MRTHPYWVCILFSVLSCTCQARKHIWYGCVSCSASKLYVFHLFILILTNGVQGFVDDGQETSPLDGFCCSLLFCTAYPWEHTLIWPLSAHAEHANATDMGVYVFIFIFIICLDTNSLTTGICRRQHLQLQVPTENDSDNNNNNCTKCETWLGGQAEGPKLIVLSRFNYINFCTWINIC